MGYPLGTSLPRLEPERSAKLLKVGQARSPQSRIRNGKGQTEETNWTAPLSAVIAWLTRELVCRCYETVDFDPKLNSL